MPYSRPRVDQLNGVINYGDGAYKTVGGGGDFSPAEEREGGGGKQFCGSFNIGASTLSWQGAGI